MPITTTELTDVANKLAGLCKQGEYDEALNTLYAEDVVTIEACDYPDMPRVAEGLDAAKKVAEWWEANHEVHGGEVKGPFLHLPDRFSVYMTIDVTPKVGPTANQRQVMEEICLYTVKDGKISRAEFFYELPPQP